jgi:NAD(P)-dependent dehydrogenase (short-subunit alcohol dehydrogenase family)
VQGPAQRRVKLAAVDNHSRSANAAEDNPQGHLDLLVNNTGFSQVGAVVDLTREDLRRQFETNVIAPMAVTAQAIPLLRAAVAPQWQRSGGQRRQHRGVVHHAVRGRVLL